MRIRIQSYGPSKSARALASYLRVLKLNNTNSRFRPRRSDTIVNWGSVKQNHNCNYLNPLHAVQSASNKLDTFRILSAANVPIPLFYTNKSHLNPSTTYVARTTLTGHSGLGIHSGLPESLPSAPLYTQYIDKTAEYRAIVVNNKVVDFKQKKRKRDFEGSRSSVIWNVSNGYVFARDGIEHPEAAYTASISALAALGLTYGAVDIIQDADSNFYVLEINTAFGIEGSTLQLVGDAIKELL